MTRTSPGARLGSGVRALLAAALVLGLAGLVTTAAPSLSGSDDSASLGLTGLTSDLGATNPLTKVTSEASTAALQASVDLKSSSAVTVSGTTAAAAKLKVTVSQTTNLVNQVINISWTGGQPTLDGVAGFRGNFLQIMQCWGDSSPDRTQCQFGSKVGVEKRPIENSRTASRQLTRSPLDPNEPLTKDADSAYVPFQPAVGKAVTGIDVVKNPYYDQNTTNEIGLAATYANGTGFQTFETQTTQEASGLDCGTRIATTGKFKGELAPCWLVIIPRGTTEVDGSDHSSNLLSTSPLSTTNWANRIVIMLRFSPLKSTCSITQAQRPVLGTEPVSEAVSRWAPALCRNKGPVFSYTQNPDSVAERSLLGTEPGLSVLTAPVAPSDIPADRILVYAPVAVSGISISFVIDQASKATAPSTVSARDGTRITELNLTPRLVAKMLTQSYLLDASRGSLYVKANPIDLAADPEFLAINSQFKQLKYEAGMETLAPANLGDAVSVLWRWVASDQDARDFIAGLPDPWGMRVNPFYQGAEIPRDDFPKVDPYCDYSQNFQGIPLPPLCTLDNHPYAQDFHDTARSANRGDTLAKNQGTDNPRPVHYAKTPAQLSGQREVLAVTDTTSAARYGVITAKLRNAAGKFVAPTKAGLTAGLATMQKTAVPGVLTSDPESTNKAAYPLTTVSYAVTAPNKLTKAEATDYAKFIRYAVGDGQKPGTGQGNLPDGYLPLTTALRNRALAVAKDVESRRGPKTTDSGGLNDGNNNSSNGGGSGNGGSSNSGSGSGASPTTPPSTTAPGTPSGNNANPAAAIAQTLFTPGDPKVAAKYALMIALTLGSAAMIFGLLLPRLARRLGE